MQKKLVAVFMGAVLVMPVVAQAEGSYVKLGVGQSEYKNGNNSRNETAASLAYGFSIDKNFGVELGYINFGKDKESDGYFSESLQRQAFYIAGVGSLPVTDTFSVFAKLGIAANRYEYNVSGLGFSESEKITKTKPMAGLGVAYNFTKEVAGTLEYQYFGKMGEYGVKSSAITAGIKYDF